MKVYISSYMTGHDGFNISAFDAKKEELEAKGAQVLNPADIVRKYGLNKPYNFYLRKAMRMLLKADVVLVFGDKKALSLSRGVKKEVSLANLVDIPVFEQVLPKWILEDR